MNEDIIKLTAEKCGVSEEEVRTEICNAITEACKNSCVITDIIPSEGKIPTPEEVIAYILSQLNNNNLQSGG